MSEKVEQVLDRIKQLAVTSSTLNSSQRLLFEALVMVIDDLYDRLKKLEGR